MRPILIIFFAASVTSAFACVDCVDDRRLNRNDLRDRYAPKSTNELHYIGDRLSKPSVNHNERMDGNVCCTPNRARWLRDRDLYRNDPYANPCIHEEPVRPGEKPRPGRPRENRIQWINRAI